MIKKYSSVIIVFAIVISIFQVNVFADISFPDLGKEHWAFQPVSQLVADGTIAGYEDGTFRPDGTVSRAEFVKMIGKGSARRDKDFKDVNSSYWGYEYIMYSGLVGSEDNNFNPEVPITRGDVAQLLWGRAGSKMGVIAPSIITSQSENKDAIAWIYQYGVMIGNDGFHLRLDDTLSRAEGAALIIRARNINETSKQIDFVNTVSPDILKTVYNSLNLFDNIAYEADKNITNGELSRAGLRLALDENTPSYNGFNVSAPFAHPYIYDLTAIADFCFGKDKINNVFINKQATVQDSMTVLTFSIIKKSHTPLIYTAKNNYYKDVTSTENDLVNSYLTFANQNGIQLYADGRLNANSPVTLKELVAIIVQIDGLFGTQTAITTDTDNKTGLPILLDQKLNKQIETYPETKDKFQCILADLPKEIYTTRFSVANKDPIFGNPILAYNFARDYNSFLTGMLQNYRDNLLSKSNVKVRFTYFPSLVCENGIAFTIRLKCEILDMPNELFIKDVFKVSSKVSETQKIYKGMVFYGDIATGQDITSTDLSMVKLDKIIYIQDTK